MAEKFMDTRRDEGTRQDRPKPLRQTVVEIDQDILRLLVRRYNILERMRRHGRLDSGEEKFLRESWQKAAAKVSRDPDLSGRFFALLQNIAFLPRPVGGEREEDAPGAKRRQTFNLAPSKEPVEVEMAAPLDSACLSAWLYLAAASGMPITLAPSAQNIPLVDFEKALDRMGAAPSWDKDVVSLRGGPCLSRPDRVIYIGDCVFSFYLLLAHYLGAPSRTRFEGDTGLKLADFSWLGQALPQLGARLVHVVPKSWGLPCRVECSGILPDKFVFTKEYQPEFAQALLLAASFYEKPFALDLDGHPAKQAILDHVLPILEASGANFTLSGFTVNMQPCALSVPQKPAIPIEPEIAFFLLSFAAIPAGKVILGGNLPQWAEINELLDIFAASGMPVKRGEGSESLKMTSPPQKLAFTDICGLNPSGWRFSLICGLCAAVALSGGAPQIPGDWSVEPAVIDFMRACGLRLKQDGSIVPFAGKDPLPVFTAENAAWACAIALAARARPGFNGFQLANPGIVNNLWPGFWTFYNNLPNPGQKKAGPAEETGKGRRRILTGAVAVPPEIREEDWER